MQGFFMPSGKKHKHFQTKGRRKAKIVPNLWTNSGIKILVSTIMAFFTNSVTALKTVVTAIGAGVAVWGIINLLEGYGNDNPGAKSQGIKHLITNL